MLALWSALFFLLAPHMHENHAMLALGLLAAAWAMGQKVGWQLSIATVIILGNCILHDHQLLRNLFPTWPEGWQTLILTPGQTVDNVSPLTIILAVTSLILAGFWTVKFLTAKKTAEEAGRVTSE